MKKIRIFLSENFHFLVAKFSVYLNRHVFVMILKTLFKAVNKMACSFTIITEKGRFADFFRLYGIFVIISFPQAIIIGFANSVDPYETAHKRLDLRCLSFSFIFSSLHIIFFPINSLLKNKADDKCSLKFGAERIIYSY